MARTTPKTAGWQMAAWAVISGVIGGSLMIMAYVAITRPGPQTGEVDAKVAANKAIGVQQSQKADDKGQQLDLIKAERKRLADLSQKIFDDAKAKEELRRQREEKLRESQRQAQEELRESQRQAWEAEKERIAKVLEDRAEKIRLSKQAYSDYKKYLANDAIPTFESWRALRALAVLHSLGKLDYEHVKKYGPHTLDTFLIKKKYVQDIGPDTLFFISIKGEDFFMVDGIHVKLMSQIVRIAPQYRFGHDPESATLLEIWTATLRTWNGR